MENLLGTIIDNEIVKQNKDWWKPVFRNFFMCNQMKQTVTWHQQKI